MLDAQILTHRRSSGRAGRAARLHVVVMLLLLMDRSVRGHVRGAVVSTQGHKLELLVVLLLQMVMVVAVVMVMQRSHRL